MSPRKPKPPTAAQLAEQAERDRIAAQQLADLRAFLAVEADMLSANAVMHPSHEREIHAIARELRAVGDRDAPSEIQAFGLLRSAMEMVFKLPTGSTPQQVCDAVFKLIDERRTLSGHLNILLSAAANIRQTMDSQ